MKISLAMLGEFVRCGDADSAADLLTARGFEVESLSPPMVSGKIVAGKIARMSPHPHADKLRIAQVDIGENSHRQIICGAANAEEGITAAVALPDSILGEVKIVRREIRGVASDGMLCSETELGMAESGDGILILDDSHRPGESLLEKLELSDQAMEIAVSPNRGDCLSHLGIAREIAADGKPLSFSPPTYTPTLDEEFPVKISPKAMHDCPRFCSVVIRGINPNAETPPKIRARLHRCGMRSVSAPVDITNYAMLEFGQPLHAFDLKKLSGGIHVRFAKRGEKILLLNGREIVLDESVLLVADSRGGQALAGIMGGEETAISESTTDILLEAAFWNPAVVRGRCRRFRLNSEAAFRFERGVDFAMPKIALARAANLFAEICGSESGPIAEAKGGALPSRKSVFVAEKKIRGVLGVAVAAEKSADILSGLGFGIALRGKTICANPPSWRFDISLAEDLIEEIARLRGYDKLPATEPHIAGDFLPVPSRPFSDANIRRRLAACGYREIISYAFADEKWERDFCGSDSPIFLSNPIAENMAAMRSGMLGGLIDRALFNFNRKRATIKIFEIGRCFEAADGDGKIRQPLRVGGLACGESGPTQWCESPKPLDFFDVKGDVESLLHGLQLKFKPTANHPALHPGKAAAIWADGIAADGVTPLGFIGEIHPRLLLSYPLRPPPTVFQIDLENLSAMEKVDAVVAVSKFPPLLRDLAVLVDLAIPAGDVLSTAKEFEREAIVAEVALFDRYIGDNIPHGKKSLGLRIALQGADGNLSEHEAEEMMSRISNALNRAFGAERRAEAAR